MAWSIVQQNEAAQNTGLATVSATLASPATAGNTILVVVGADAYAATPPSGYTESTGCKQQTNLGHYVWWKVAAGGETSVSYTIGSAATSVWEIYEIAGLTASPYDISAGQFIASGSSAYTTPSITPTAGERLIVASMGGSTSAADFTGLSAWLNSFTEQNETTNTKASGTRDIIGMATLSATADGLTGYSSGATYSPNATARTGIIIAFKVASGATTHVGAASGASTSTGTAAVTLKLAAVASGASTSTGSAAVTQRLAAASSGASTSTGTAAATVVPPGTVTYQAAGSGASTSTGSAAVTLRLAAFASGASTSTGAAAITLRLVAAASGTSASAGSAAAGRLMAAAAVGASVSAGSANGSPAGPPAAGTPPRYVTTTQRVRYTTSTGSGRYTTTTNGGRL